ncbi:MAG: glycine cleavage system protein GcvH [Candidatus Acetothermia bacterium]
MANNKDLKYTEDHDWVEKSGHKAKVGITDYAQNELGDIVFVELPGEGEEFSQGEELVVVESVKSVSNVKAPISGTVTAVNDKLEGEPELINESPWDEGWLVELDVEDEDEIEGLMSEEEYEDFAVK